jgi:hypothetical protein
MKGAVIAHFFHLKKIYGLSTHPFKKDNTIELSYCLPSQTIKLQ